MSVSTERANTEDVFESLVHRSPTGVYVVQDGKLRYVNPMFLTITGYREDELLGRDLLELVVPEDRKTAGENAGKMLIGQTSAPYQFRVACKDGDTRLVMESVGAIRYRGASATMGSVMDITERGHTEEALCEGEDRYRSLVNNIEVGIFRSTPGPDGRFLEVNRAMEKMTGYSREELLRIDVARLYRNPEEREEAIREIESTGCVLTREICCSKKDGQEIVVSDMTVPVTDCNGRLLYLDGILEDITERKKMGDALRKAAEEWSKTFDSISDAISIHSRDGRLVRVNRAFTDMFHADCDEHLGGHCYTILHGTNAPVPACPHLETLRTGKTARAEFFEPHLGVHLELTTSPLLDETGEVTGTVHIASDITERKRQDEHMLMADRMVSIGELAAGAAHELNNPLTSVIGFSRLLMERDIPADIRDDLRTIYGEAQRASAVIEQLLKFAHSHPSVKHLYQVNDIVEDVLRLRAYEQRTHHIKVERALDQGLPEIMIDYFKIQQVLLNIVLNAEQSMIEANAGGTLAVATSRRNGAVVISVADDGAGIAKKHMGQVFNPFFTTKPPGKGTGLGLSISYGIVNEHGGRIRVISEPVKGARFVVELPINGSSM
ncbi:MAG: PAS domain S-box protein [Dehalococcoidia bacterium]